MIQMGYSYTFARVSCGMQWRTTPPSPSCQRGTGRAPPSNACPLSSGRTYEPMISPRPQALYTGILTNMAMIIPVGEKVGEARALRRCRPVYGIETWSGRAAGSIANPLGGGLFSIGVGLIDLSHLAALPKLSFNQATLVKCQNAKIDPVVKIAWRPVSEPWSEKS